MNNKLVLFLATSLVLVVAGPVAAVSDDGNFEYWNTESASVKINDETKFTIEEEFRFGDDFSDFYYQHSDVGIAYSGLASWLSISANYRAVLEEKSNDWTWENRPHLNFTLKGDLDGLALSTRSRLEFRIFREKEDKPRYRNKMTVKFPFKWTRFNLQPYIADEVFINVDGNGRMTRNRIYSGISGKITDDIKGELYFMVQSNKSSSGVWTDINVIGTKLKFSF